MAVRNVKNFSGNSKPIPVIHYIPPAANYVYKLEVVTDSGIIDFTDIISEGYWSGAVTDRIGDFEFRILDPNNTSAEKIEEFDTVNVYMDYGSTATTLKFSGRIERKPNSQDFYLVFSGRSSAMVATGTNITYSSDGLKSRKQILIDIIALHPEWGVSSSGVEEDDGEISVDYDDKPWMDVITEICASGGRDAYMSPDLIFNYFVIGSRLNETEAVVENSNLIKTIEFGKDTEEVVTSTRVYGSRIQGLPLISTSESDTTLTKGIVKQKRIDNSSAINSQQTSELATSEYLSSKIPPEIGKIVSVMLPTISPGEKIKISNPTNKIPPGEYEIAQYTHKITQEGISTVLDVKKKRLDLSKILKSNFKFQTDIKNNNNPNDFNSTFVINFDQDIGIHDNTEFSATNFDNNGNIIEGQVKLISGESSGTWISPGITASSFYERLQVNLSGEDISGINVWISTDDKSTWVQTNNPGGFTFTTNNTVYIRLDFDSSPQSVKAIALFYDLV